MYDIALTHSVKNIDIHIPYQSYQIYQILCSLMIFFVIYLLH